MELSQNPQSLGFNFEDEDVETSFHASPSESRPTNFSSRTSNSPSPILSQNQMRVYFVTHILALICLCLVIIWIQNEKMGGGGVSWTYGESGKVFNWHPVLMVTSFVFMSIGAIVFRRPLLNQDGNETKSRKFYSKVGHVLSWTVACICGIIGIIAVVRSHNDPVSGYIANLYSFHSWMGCAVLGIYLFQFLVGLNVFGLANLTIVRFVVLDRIASWLPWRAKILVAHKFVGKSLYFLTSLTILLGIMEKETFVGCGYKVEEADVRPYEHWNEISVACKVGHSLGIGIVLMTLCVGYVLSDIPIRS